MLSCLALPAAAMLPQGFRSDDIAVFQAMARLGAAALGDCAVTGPDAGWLLHDASQYATRDRPVIAAAFGLDRGVGVLDVVPGGPAAAAGIAAGDVLMAIDGAPVLIDAPLSPGPFTVSVRRGGRTKVVGVRPRAACRVTAAIVRSRRVNAYATSSQVQITEPMVAFVRDQGELAALLGHELAHAVLRHPPHAGAAAERAADRYSIRLLVRAGYPLASARAFWARLLAGGDRQRAARLAAIDEAIADIDPAPRRAPNALEFRR